MPSPSDVIIRLSPSADIELIATVTVLNVLSPARNVLLFLVPLPRRARGTVPDDRLDAFNAYIPEPLEADKVDAEIFNPDNVALFGLYRK